MFTKRKAAAWSTSKLARKRTKTRAVAPNLRVTIPGSIGPAGSAQQRIAFGMGASRRLKVEKKFVDLNDASYNLNSTIQFTLLNAIRAGSSEFNRIGRKIQMKYLYIHWLLNTLRTVATEDVARVMVVYDRQTNGAAPSFADIVRSVQQDGTTTSSGVIDHINLDNTQRFQVLLDKILWLPSMTWTAGVVTNLGQQDSGGNNVRGHWFLKLRNLETKYKADSSPAVIGDIASGALWLVTQSSQASGAEGYALEAAIRLRYIDV